MDRFQKYREDYERLWGSLTIRPGRMAEAQKEAEELLKGKPVYLAIERRTGVPWWFLGLCHYRESHFNFNTYLGNGQRLDRRTTIVPKGRGPFLGPNAFEDGAVDAMRLQGFAGASDWSIARALYRLEGFNGYGYHGKNVNSPYLYGGSTAYGPPESRAGKYVADHVFDPSHVDRQLGTAVILKALMKLDPSIALPQSGGMSPHEPEDEMMQSALWLQQSLNKLGAEPRLAEDGVVGSKTMAAVSRFQQDNGLTDTGMADAATVAAIERKLQGATPATRDVVPPDLTLILEQLATIIEKIKPPAGIPGTQPPADPNNQMRRVLEILNTIVSPAGKSVPLGEVNGALGETVGKMLTGKKTALGLLGAILTPILSRASESATPIGKALEALAPTLGGVGLGPVAMPLFLGLTAWGILGKFEKWAQGTAPPPKNT